MGIKIRNWNSYLTWCDEGDAFDPATPPDASVRSFDIEGDEGKGALFTVSAKRFAGGPLNPARKRYAYHWRKTEDGTGYKVRKGRFFGIPGTEGKSDWVELKFQCLPTNWKQQEIDTAAPYAVLPWFDPMISGPSGAIDPTQILEGRRARIEWNPFTLTPSVVDILGVGCPEIVINEGEFYDVRVNQVGDPVTSVLLKVNCEYVQQRAGIANCGDQVASAFRANVVNTLTPEDFVKRMPQVGSGVNGQSGYVCSRSALRVRNPPPGYARFAGPFSGSSERYDSVQDYVDTPGSDTPPPVARPVVLERTWFDIDLQFFWSINQKRQEKFWLTIPTALQNVGLGVSNAREIVIGLQDVSLDAVTGYFIRLWEYNEGDRIKVGETIWAATRAHRSANTFDEDFYAIVIQDGFNVRVANWTKLGANQSALGGKDKDSHFLTDRGEQTISACVLKALAQVADSSRCVEIVIDMPLTDKIMDITTGHKITIFSNQIYGGGATAKVTSYRLRCDAKQDHAQITLKAVPGTGDEDVTYPPGSGHGYVNATAMAWDRTTWADYSAPGPIPLWNGGLRVVNVVQEPETVPNWSPGQIDIIYANQFDDAAGRTDPDATDPVTILQNAPTQIQLIFGSIASTDMLTHYKQFIVSAWMGPKQIELRNAA